MDDMNNVKFDFRTVQIAEDVDPVSFEESHKFHTIDGEGKGEGTVGVVMDSGIDVTHPVFSDVDIKRVDPNNFGGSNPDQVGHGTACAGQIVKIAPEVDLLIDLPIFSGRGTTGMQQIENAYDWLLNNKDQYDAVNMSWGSRQKINQLDKIHNELAKDKFCSVAAGNSGQDGGSPATASEAFSVGACDRHGKMAQFSSAAPNLDNPEVAALGKNMMLHRAKDTSMGSPITGYRTQASGTSFAAPIVTGCYLKAKSAYPDYKVDDKFISKAVNIPETPDDGAGYLNYDAAISPEPEPEPEEPEQEKTWWEQYLDYLRRKYGVR